MRAFITPVALVGMSAILSLASPAVAQSERGYLGGSGAFAATPDTTSPALLVEGGIKVLPHILAYGNLGYVHNLQSSEIQPAVDATTSLLAESQGLDVTGVDRTPTTYTTGGVRYELFTKGKVLPYALGGIGVAHLMPTAKFTAESGTLADGSAATVGQNITSQLETAGEFTMPASSNAFLFSLGGGIEIPMNRHWAADAGYRFSRIEADSPLNTQGATVGLGYRF